MTKPAQGTRERLQQALLRLIRERGYDAITIQDIVDRAQLGRTTFYLHYHSKDELFLACHEAFVGQFHMGPHAGSRDELLAAEAPQEMTMAYRHLTEARALLNPILRGREGLLILRLMRDRSAKAIEASLRFAFAESDSAIPLGVLANYLAGAQVGLVQWWLETRPPYSPEHVAQTFQRLQRAAICEAFGVTNAG